MKKEIRSAASMNVRPQDDNMVIEGKAVVFDTPALLYTDTLGNEYYERIAPGALDECRMEDCCLKYNHKDEAPILARTRGGSLALEKKPDGLYFRAELFNTQFSRDCYELVKADALQCSFCFSIAEGGETYDKQARMRTVTKIDRLWDLAIVTVPAYRDTFVKQARAYCAPYEQNAIEEKEREELRGMVEAYKPADEYDLESLSYDEVLDRLSEIRAKAEDRDCSARGLLEEAKRLKDWQETLERRAKKRAEIREAVANGAGEVIARPPGFTSKKGEKNNVEQKETMEMRAFQRYVAEGTLKNLSTEERAALTTSGSGAVMPTEIFNSLITNEKYSDLLSRATVINLSGAGTLKVPVASHNTAVWKEENAAVTPETPTLTSLDLGGKEMMRAIQYSAAVRHMSTSEFTAWMSDLCASELVETLESAFVTGSTEEDAPHNGLQHLVWTKDKNAVEAAAAMEAADVAKGLSLLPQKYARNAILLMNANTAYNTVGLFKGTSEYAYSLADGAARFMSKEIHISEYCADNEIYIVDPKQLYVRFAMDPVVDVDESVGFLSGTSTMRCLAVVDFAWNPDACVRVGLAAG